jgi:hypothetical protein
VVQIREVGLDARDRVIHSGSDREREPFRQAIRRLTADQVLELVPDVGESLRKLKLLTSRAATDVGRRIQYGETPGRDTGRYAAGVASVDQAASSPRTGGIGRHHAQPA